MKKKYTPIAMRCNQEQFDEIKPRLKVIELVNNADLHLTSESSPYKRYLTNYYNARKLVSSTLSPDCYKETKIHETWNERIFLEACGIKVDDVFEITKEQISDIFKLSSLEGKKVIKELFPSVFDVELIVGKWYKACSSLFCYQKNDKSYGFTDSEWSDCTWVVDESSIIDKEWNPVPASDSEIKYSLISEAKKRGYKEGDYIKRRFDIRLHDAIIDNNKYPHDDEYHFDAKENFLEYLGFVIFSKGLWAERFDTITKAEAEKLLNKKII